MPELNPTITGDTPITQMRLVTSSVEDDGAVVTITKVRESAATMIAATTRESVTAGIWSKTTTEPISDLLTWSITEQVDIGTAGTPTRPILREDKWNDQFYVIESHYSQYVPAGTTKPIIGDAYAGGYVASTNLLNTEHALIKRMVWMTMPLPPTRIEYASKSYPLPTIFAYLAAWPLPSYTGFLTVPPFPGVHYTHVQHGVSTKPARVVTSYTLGPSGTVPATWQVITPGIASKITPISGNTIHNAIVIVETGSAGTLLVENLPASTPASYTPGQSLIVDASERNVVGAFYEKKVYTVTE